MQGPAFTMLPLPTLKNSCGIPVLAEADLVAEGLVAQLAGVGLLAVMGTARVHLEAVRRGEHLLALHARVQVAELMQARPLGRHVVEVQVRRVRQTQMSGDSRWHAPDAHADANADSRRCGSSSSCRGRRRTILGGRG